ncbi:MAG: hypothetical protein ACFFG0_37075 [Candidatus Thorarchaeota archaeon]
MNIEHSNKIMTGGFSTKLKAIVNEDENFLKSIKKGKIKKSELLEILKN